MYSDSAQISEVFAVFSAPGSVTLEFAARAVPFRLLKRFAAPAVHTGTHTFRLARTYGDTRPGEYLALVNSFGVIEIARAEQSAAEGLGLSRGAPVEVREGAPHQP